MFRCPVVLRGDTIKTIASFVVMGGGDEGHGRSDLPDVWRGVHTDCQGCTHAGRTTGRNRDIRHAPYGSVDVLARKRGRLAPRLRGTPAGTLRDTWATSPATGLIPMQATLTVTDVTTIGFARFVGLNASALYVSDFDYTPTTPTASPNPIPEPTTMALVGLGLLAAARKRFR